MTIPRKRFIFILMALLILFFNFAIYSFPSIQPLPNQIYLATLFDFMIVLPVLGYFLLIKNNLSLKKILILCIGCAFLGTKVIPAKVFPDPALKDWIYLILEAVFITFETFVLINFIKALPSLIKDTRYIDDMHIFLPSRIERSTNLHYQNKTSLFQILLFDISLYYFSLFSWRKEIHIQPGWKAFTYHKKTSTAALYLMLIHALLIETLGVHYLIHEMIEWLSYILLAGDIYIILLFIAEFQAIRKCPIILTGKHLHFQIGIFKRVTIHLNAIEDIIPYTGPEKLDKQHQKDVFEAAAADFIKEKPQYEIQLKNAVTATYIYGKKKIVSRILVRLDDPDSFFYTLKLAIESSE